MLKKNLRIPRKDLDAIFKKKGFFCRGTILSLKYVKNNLKHTRWAFISSLKEKRAAVYRNLARRRMNEAVQGFANKVQPGLDIVFMLKLAGKKVPSQEIIRNDMIHILDRCGLYV
jgi:ribonuclease P protein component